MSDETREQQPNEGTEQSKPLSREEKYRQARLQMEAENAHLKSLEKSLFDSGILEQWVAERTLLPPTASYVQKAVERWTTPIGRERNARRGIADTMENEILFQLYPMTYGIRGAMKPDYRDGGVSMNSLGMVTDASHMLDGYRTPCQKILAGCKAVDTLLDAGVELKTVKPDTITGEQITTEVVREQAEGAEGGYKYTAREIGSDGRVITEAKIGDVGRFLIFPEDEGYELTLNFAGEHYEGRNPSLQNVTKLPVTTAMTFSLLANAVVADIRKSPTDLPSPFDFINI